MKYKHIIAQVLLAFVFVSVGYVVGKEVTLHRLGDRAAETPSAEVIVYYMHPTVRCATCQQIEKMTREIVDREFGQAKQAGRLAWRDVNFHENEALARQFDVSSSSVVLVRMKGGKVESFERLDDVWTLVNKPVEFDGYVTGAIRRYVDGEK